MDGSSPWPHEEDDWTFEDEDDDDMKVGTRVVHVGSGLCGVITETDQGYYWVSLDDGSSSYIHGTELSIIG